MAHVACGSSTSSLGSDAGLDGGREGGGDASGEGGGDAASDGSSGHCRGMSEAIHRAEATACGSNKNDDAGCGIVPHDQCLTDSNCGAIQDCLCQSPIPAGQPCPEGVGTPSGNVCIPSNCRVDSDCSPCGLCEAEYSCGSITGYFCQTPEDECTPTGPGQNYEGNGCTFQSGRWASGNAASCPG
jgi:hypothetical protein